MTHGSPMLTRTQLTGLSDSCRRHVVTISGGADAQERVPPRAAETAAPHKIARPRRRSATPARATPNHRLPPTALRPTRPNPEWSRTPLSCIQTL